MARKLRALHTVLVEALEAASYSASKLAADAGLDWSTLAKWKSGARAPQATNAADVGRALTTQGRMMQKLGDELVSVAEAEAASRRPTPQGGTPTPRG